MAAKHSNFLDRVLGRIGRLDAHGLQTIVERLARERSFLETLFNTIEDGVLVADEGGRILYYNAATTALLGLQPGSAEGHPIARYLPELDWARLAAMDNAGGRQVVRHEFEVQLPRPRFLRLYAAPLDGESIGSAGVALILHDATEARQKTFEAIESERVQALTLLAASVAHEIGNPLNALDIHLQLIERELKKLGQEAGIPETSPGGKRPRPRPAGAGAIGDHVAKLVNYVAVAKGEIARLDNIITQFLQAIRPSPPRIKLAFLNDVVRDTLELLRPELENRGLIVNEHLTRHLPATPIDPTQIKQVLVNLIKNAMQAMSKGGTLKLQTGAGEDGVWFEVADTGGGIPQETINRIFQPFYTTKKKGSGLGLMIVHRIIREHGGRIDLKSRVSEGTTFRIWLPLRERQPRLLEAHLHD